MAKIYEVCESKNIAEITLMTRGLNSPARNFYTEKQGFVPVLKEETTQI